MNDKHLLHVRVVGEEASLRAFLTKRPPGCERIERRGERPSIEVFLPADELATWRQQGLQVQVLYDVRTRLQTLAEQVGRFDRFADGSLPPAYGLAAPPTATPMGHYDSVDEVASACKSLASKFSSHAELLPLGQTHGGNTPHALRVGERARSGRPAFMIIGGQHGHEYGSSEIILNLANVLLQGRTSGLDFGNQFTFTAADVEAVLRGLDLVLLPLVNPDGRAYSQDNQQAWRKNRRPPPAGSSAYGVDLNRNFDYLFNLQPNAGNSVVSGSNVAADDFYRGTGAFSEPESGNVKSLAQTFKPRWFADLHSGARCVVYPHSVGAPDAAALPPQEVTDHTAMGAVYAGAVESVSGNKPPVQAGFDFVASSGTSHDWIHEDGAQAGVAPLAFMIEWSSDPAPLWTVMEAIILEVTAGLVAMCQHALSNPR